MEPSPPPLSRLEAEAREGRSCGETLSALRKLLRDDPRPQALALLLKWEKKTEKENKESARLDSLLRLEQEARKGGAALVAGVDEAGRGPLAGPVVAASVVFPEKPDLGLLRGLDDSKKLSPRKREELYPLIQQAALGFGVGWAQASEIDSINILQASRRAMERAVMKTSPHPDYLILDALTIEGFPKDRQIGVIRGDSLSLSVAAASVLAKVTRDRLMDDLDAKYPGYGFARHKGYGTAEHLSALARLGPCPEHRRSFAPVSQLNLLNHGEHGEHGGK